jgi:hypothetical protein
MEWVCHLDHKAHLPIFLNYRMIFLNMFMQALDFQDPEVHHRHLSHLFGIYPGHTITLEKNADVCEAAANSLYKRGLKNINKLFKFYDRVV